MGLFSYLAPVQPAENLSTVERRWHVWVGQERLRRLAWAIFEYDSSVSYLHNMRPYTSIGDMTLDLPGSNAHWEAETPQSWAALHPWSLVPSTVPFRETLRTFFDNTPNPLSKRVEDSHQLLIIMILDQLLWSTNDGRRSPVCEFVDTNSWSSSRQILRSGLNMFQASSLLTETLSDTTLNEQALIVRRVQVLHSSHLHNAGDLMDLIRRLVRPLSDHKAAERGFVIWAKQDPERVREIAFHAAQTLAMVRHFASNLPLEPFDVFHAGVVLWSLSALLHQDASHRESSDSPSATIYLDHLAKHEDDTASTSTQDWLQNGGCSTLGLFSVPNLCTPIGQIQVLELVADMLKKMPVWGVAVSFRRVILGLRKRSPPTAVV